MPAINTPISRHFLWYDRLFFWKAITYSDRLPAAEQFMRLRRHLKDDAIVELTATIAFQNLSSKFNAALGVEPQDFARPRPSRRRGRPNEGDHREAFGPFTKSIGRVQLARREERDALAQFGETYARYMESTPAFFPSLKARATSPREEGR